MNKLEKVKDEYIKTLESDAYNVCSYTKIEGKNGLHTIER